MGECRLLSTDTTGTQAFVQAMTLGMLYEPCGSRGMAGMQRRPLTCIPQSKWSSSRL